ncbi:MAG TPA: hypothetical protein VEH81_05305 [Ktedonobacteraceae bacterium]|nr:hypothetical protein [Ktedonobacteraceae bacterium]
MQFEEILTILVSCTASILAIGSTIDLMSKLMEKKEDREKRPKTFEIKIKDASGNLIETKIVHQEDAEKFLRMLSKVPGNTSVSTEHP